MFKDFFKFLASHLDRVYNSKNIILKLQSLNRPIVARVTWDFACVFVCFGSRILFDSFEKVFILALERIRFPSLLTLRDFILQISLSKIDTVYNSKNIILKIQTLSCKFHFPNAKYKNF